LFDDSVNRLKFSNHLITQALIMVQDSQLSLMNEAQNLCRRPRRDAILDQTPITIETPSEKSR
jgi:hypothetical protein